MFIFSPDSYPVFPSPYLLKYLSLATVKSTPITTWIPTWMLCCFVPCLFTSPGPNLNEAAGCLDTSESSIGSCSSLLGGGCACPRRLEWGPSAWLSHILRTHPPPPSHSCCFADPLTWPVWAFLSYAGNWQTGRGPDLKSPGELTQFTSDVKWHIHGCWRLTSTVVQRGG